MSSAIDLPANWDEIDARFEWVRAMRGCVQDPIHHAEGDVWIHTRMVLEALHKMPAWNALAARERDIVFAASLLHDVAKPACTRTDADGRTTSRGHSTRGAIVARRILWRMGASFEEREAICGLVRHHQVPFFAVDREDAARTVRTISQVARCDHLALVAEADARGRHCADKQRLLDNIELFRELCAESGCLDSPARFPTAHARVLYLRRDTNDPTYAPHEDFRCDVVVMSGLPGAGKDTWIGEHLASLPMISLDAIRKELEIAAREPQGVVVARAYERARELLRERRDFAWNATNLSRRVRDSVVNLLLRYGARVRIVYVETSPEELQARNSRRGDDAVPEAVVEALLDRWEVPAIGEAHEVTFVVPPRLRE